MAILDDCELIGTGVAALLAPYAQDMVVRTVSSFACGDEVDVVLFDPRDCPARIRRLRELAAGEDVAILVFSWASEVQITARTDVAGVAGWVSKAATAPELAGALRAAYAQRRTTSATARPRRVADGSPHGSRGPKAGQLSPREEHVLSLVAQGLSNREIAQVCYLSVNTVKTHIRTGYRKIGVSRRAQAVAWMLEHEVA